MTVRSRPFPVCPTFSRDSIRQEGIHQREVNNLKSKLFQIDEVIAVLLTEHIELRKDCGKKLKVQWFSVSTSDQIVDLISHWKQSSRLRDNWFFRGFGLGQKILVVWRKRSELKNLHDSSVLGFEEYRKTSKNADRSRRMRSNWANGFDHSR